LRSAWRWLGSVDFIEEALDEIAVAIEEGADGLNFVSPWQGLDVGPSTTILHGLEHGVRIVSAVGDEELAGAPHGLSGGKLERNGQAVGID
jgi:hypothetical protein